MHTSGHIAAAAGGGIQRSWIVRNAVRNAEVEAVLDNVEHGPSAVLQDPLLQTSGGKCLGIGDIGLAVDGLIGDELTVAFIANVKRGGVRKEEAEREGSVRAVSGVGEAGKDGEGHSGQGGGATRGESARGAGLVDGVDAVAAAALRYVPSVVVDHDAAEVGVLAGLVAAELQPADHADVGRHRRRQARHKKLRTSGGARLMPSCVLRSCFFGRLPLLSLPAM